MTHAAPRPSLPGLTRQSILPKDVDARDKPGHDGGGGLSVGVSTLARIADRFQAWDGGKTSQGILSESIASRCTSIRVSSFQPTEATPSATHQMPAGTVSMCRRSPLVASPAASASRCPQTGRPGEGVAVPQ